MASLILRNNSHSLNPKPHQTLLNFTRLYSFSSSNNDNDGNTPTKPSNFSSYFTRIKDQQQQQQQSSTNGSSFDEIRNNLSEFRRRSSDTPANSNTQLPNFNKNVVNPNPNPNPSISKGGNLSYERIRESLAKMRGNKVDMGRNVNEQLSLDKYKESFRTKPSMGKITNNTSSGSRVFGGTTDSLPSATFGKEINENLGEDDSSKFDLNRVYTHAELGERLKALRPEMSVLGKDKNKKNKGKEGDEGWFSLSELQQRIGKLKEIEKMESGDNVNMKLFGDLRKSLRSIQDSKDQNENPKVKKLDLLVPSYFTTSPPQEHLIEKYFHPDNMSSAEKLKIELKKVRDEFKMSESDCGSTRVQIAQLTTEIHHLSSVLHKKDKHSRRGLQAKVQQRKKLLKYLRRTDWDSYCFVLSKLGLRDNPDYKN